MGTSNSKKKSLPDCEQKNNKAEKKNDDATSQNPMPDMKQSSDWKQTSFRDFWTKPVRMKTGCNGIDVSKYIQYEQNDIQTVKQAVQCS